MGEAGDEESTHKWLDLHTVILGQREAFQSGERSKSRRPSRRTAIAIIISERIANFAIILISMREAIGMIACPILLYASGRRTRKR